MIRKMKEGNASKHSVTEENH